MDTKGYKPPSNLIPSLVVGGLALIYPIILINRIATSPHGIADLPIARTIIWLTLYILQLTYHTIPFFTSPLNNLPRPTDEKPITGSSRGFITRHVAFNRWTRTIPNAGLIHLRGILFFTHTILLTSPAALAEVLNTRSYDFEKPRLARRFLTRVLGTGLVVAEGAEHKAQRRAVAPAFQGRHIKDLVPLFWAKARQMVELVADGTAAGSDRWKSGKPAVRGMSVNAQGERCVEVEIGGLASRATLDIIGKAGLGRDFGTIVNEEDELARQYDIILDPKKGNLLIFVLMNSLVPQWLGRQVPWKLNQRINEAAIKLRGICRNLISDKKQILQREKAESASGKTQIDILSVLMRKQEIDDDGLINQMLTFLAAGHETTSSALTWCTYLLCAHPEVQVHLREELEASPLVDFSEDVTAEDVDALPYLSAVCAETLRVYPTVPVTARVATRETRILDQVVPKGTEIIICPWAINKHPELWGPDTDDFKPERWLEGEKSGERGMNTYEFITFLHGPRSCIGQGFARSELKCLLAALVLKFRMELMEPGKVPVPAGAVTIKPKDGMHLRLTEIVR